MGMTLESKQRIIKTIAAAGLLLTVALAVYGVATGFFWNKTAIESFLQGAGIWAPIVFLSLHIVQIVIPVIPGGACLAVGVIFFGPWLGFFYNIIGISVGSCLSFLLARRFGKPFLEVLVDPEKYAKYEGWLEKGKRFDWLFGIAILLPFAPDDLLCMMAGLTQMSFRKFVLTILLCKPATILVYSLAALAIF